MTKNDGDAAVAQLVEQCIRNVRVHLQFTCEASALGGGLRF